MKASNSLRPFQGDIYYMDLDPAVGHEQAKTRPCVIISSNSFNRSVAKLIIVLPLTSKNKNHPLYIPVSPQDSGLKVHSSILCHQIRTVSIDRIKGNRIGTISQHILRHVSNIFEMLFNFN